MTNQSRPQCRRANDGFDLRLGLEPRRRIAARFATDDAESIIRCKLLDPRQEKKTTSLINDDDTYPRANKIYEGESAFSFILLGPCVSVVVACFKPILF